MCKCSNVFTFTRADVIHIVDSTLIFTKVNLISAQQRVYATLPDPWAKFRDGKGSAATCRGLLVWPVCSAGEAQQPRIREVQKRSSNTSLLWLDLGGG